MTKFRKALPSHIVSPKNDDRQLSLPTLSLVVAIPFLTYGVFGSLPIALITAAGLVWIYFAVLVEPAASKGLSAARLYLPIFLIYNGVALQGPSIRHVNDILIMTILSAVGFLVGWMMGLPRRENLSQFMPSQDFQGNTLFRRPAIMLIVLITAAVYGFSLFQAGTLPVMADNPNTARVTFLPNGYVSTIVVMGLHVMIACGFIDGFLVRSKIAKIFPVGILILGCAMAFAMGNRGVAINPIVFALLYVLWHRNFRLQKLVPISLVGIMALSLAGYYRNLSSWGQTYISDLEMQGFSGAGVWLAPVMNYVFGTAQTFDRSISVFPERIDFQGGLQFFSPLFLEQSVDLYLKDIFGLSFEGFGLALGSVNAFYLDWGYLGTFLGPMIYGFVVSLIYRKALLSSTKKWSLVYCFILMQLIFSVYGHPFAYLTYFIEPFLFYWLVIPNKEAKCTAVLQRSESSKTGPIEPRRS